MKPFTEEMRYQYDLTPDSVVMDVGGYEGNFAGIIYDKYKCLVCVFEPIVSRANAIAARFGNSKIRVFPFGIGGSNRNETFRIKGGMTGLYADDGESVTVQITSVSYALGRCGVLDVDLLKLNVEGMEYEILEYILDQRLTNRFKNIQVQFHHVQPDSAERRDKIRDRLSVTHELTYDAPFVWENWTLL